MFDCKPVSAPMEYNKRFNKATENDNLFDVNIYQSEIGSLLYASVASRPYISFSVGVLSQFMSNPTQEHWSAVKPIFRYIKGTLNYSLQFVLSKASDITLYGYADADWAGDFDARKSTSGYVFYIGQSIISWCSKRQSVVALSTAEAEYISLCNAATEAIWLRQLFRDLGFTQNKSTIIYEDNQSSIASANDGKFQSRTKHIDTKFHFMKDVVAQNLLDIVYCELEHMKADILTKSLPRNKFKSLRNFLGIVPKNS